MIKYFFSRLRFNTHGSDYNMKLVEYGDNSSQNYLIQLIDKRELEEIEDEIRLIVKHSNKSICILAFIVDSWNKDLSPWSAPAVFGNEDFGDGAKNTLNEILQYTDDPEKDYYLGGYSLAGLFALWSAYQTDRFSGIAAVSPSIWFPGFTKYMYEHKPLTTNVYLSLGDREEKTKNPVMAQVGNAIRVGYESLKDNKIHCTMEWNQGNHFKEPELRMAKGFAWLLKKG